MTNPFTIAISDVNEAPANITIGGVPDAEIVAGAVKQMRSAMDRFMGTTASTAA